MNKKILILGDSLCKGVSLNEEKKRYCFLKNSFANNLSQALDVDVINTAKFGTTVRHGIQKLGERLDKYSPDVVLIEYGGNDCDFLWNEIATDPYSEHMPKTPIDEFEADLKSMVNTVLDFGATPVLMTLPPLNANKYFEWFTGGDSLKCENILKWLGDISKIYWWHERYSIRVNMIACELGLPVVEARGYFLKTPDFRKYVCSDGIHPNESGHKIITSSILDCFNKNPQILIS